MSENITKKRFKLHKKYTRNNVNFWSHLFVCFFFLRNIIRFICEQGLQDIEYGIISTLDPTKLFHPR